MNPTSLVCRVLVRLFPRPARERFGPEMVADLDERFSVREAAGMVAGAGAAWRSHLRSPASVRSGLAAGAVMWFGLLVGIGPLQRSISQWRDPELWDQIIGAQPAPSAVGFLATGLFGLAVVSKRLLAAVLILGGCLLAGLSNRAEFWGLTEATLYELRWFVPAGAALLVLRQPVTKNALPALFGALVGVLGIGAAAVGRNYSYAIRDLIVNAVPDSSTPLVYLALGAALVLVAIGPLLAPGAAATALPAVAHIGLVSLAASIRSGLVVEPAAIIVTAWWCLAIAARTGRTTHLLQSRSGR